MDVFDLHSPGAGSIYSTEKVENVYTPVDIADSVSSAKGAEWVTATKFVRYLLESSVTLMRPKALIVCRS